MILLTVKVSLLSYMVWRRFALVPEYLGKLQCDWVT